MEESQSARVNRDWREMVHLEEFVGEGSREERVMAHGPLQRGLLLNEFSMVVRKEYERHLLLQRTCWKHGDLG